MNAYERLLGEIVKAVPVDDMLCAYFHYYNNEKTAKEQLGAAIHAVRSHHLDDTTACSVTWPQYKDGKYEPATS